MVEGIVVDGQTSGVHKLGFLLAFSLDESHPPELQFSRRPVF